MTPSILRTVLELQEQSTRCRYNGQHKLAELLSRAALQLETARVEAMPKDEPVIIFGRDASKDRTQ